MDDRPEHRASIAADVPGVSTGSRCTACAPHGLGSLRRGVGALRQSRTCGHAPRWQTRHVASPFACSGPCCSAKPPTPAPPLLSRSKTPRAAGAHAYFRSGGQRVKAVQEVSTVLMLACSCHECIVGIVFRRAVLWHDIQGYPTRSGQSHSCNDRARRHRGGRPPWPQLPGL